MRVRVRAKAKGKAKVRAKVRAKVHLGEADAGVCYASDVTPAIR